MPSKQYIPKYVILLLWILECFLTTLYFFLGFGSSIGSRGSAGSGMSTSGSASSMSGSGSGGTSTARALDPGLDGGAREPGISKEGAGRVVAACFLGTGAATKKPAH